MDEVNTNTTVAYECRDNDETYMDCATNCIGLFECSSCPCTIIPDTTTTTAIGPWGRIGDFLLCSLPIFFLITVTVKRNPWKTTISLPTSALLIFLVRLMYLGLDPLQTSACVILGIHEAVTPLSIMMGAITLFQTMEHTHCMPYMMREVKELTKGHVVAEAMLIYCLSVMIEGAGGFGTPLAICTPMLVRMGHEPFHAVVMMLSWYNFPTIWGAAGAPLWFGFGNLGLSEEELLQISYKAQTCMCVASFILIPFILRITMPLKVVKANILFILLSIAGTIGPALGLSFVSYEFSSLVGGLIGSIFCAALITLRIGLSDVTYLHANTTISNNNNHQDKDPPDMENNQIHCDQDEKDKDQGQIKEVGQEEIQVVTDCTVQDYSDTSDNVVLLQSEDDKHSDDRQEDHHKIDVDNNNQDEDNNSLQLQPRKSEGYLRETLGRTFPIWGIVLILMLTRVNQIGFKKYLTQTEPYIEIHFRTYGDLRISPSLVIMLRNILSYPNLNWTFPALYIPFFFPFILISMCTMFLYRKEMTKTPMDIARTVLGRMRNPTIALTGALILVQLIIQGDTSAPSYILGDIFASSLKGGFVAISAILGALGTFFCGSGAVSNLTFGSVQRVAANGIGISDTSILGLQAVGAAAGNSISLGNIISTCAVIGLTVKEGKIFIRTACFAFSLTTIATIVMLIFYIRF